MFIYKGKRINIDVPFTTDDGTKYQNLFDPRVRTELGIQEIPEPTPPEDFNPDYYFVNEVAEAPYTIYERKPHDMIRATILSKIDSAIEGYIQQQVRDLGGYVSVERLVSVYSNSPNPLWKSHALAVPNWVTAIWTKADQILSDVENGSRSIPTIEELLKELPKITEYILAE